MVVTSTAVKSDIGEAYRNLSLEGATATDRDAVVASQIHNAAMDVADLTGSSSGYDQIVRHLAGAYCIDAAKIAQGPDSNLTDAFVDLRDKLFEKAKYAALRKGFRLEAPVGNFHKVND